MRPLFPALVLLNAVFAGLIISMPAVSGPEPSTIIDAGVPARSFGASDVVQAATSPLSTAETTMFGLSGATGDRPASAPATPPPPPRGGDIHLLGVLMAQQGGDRQSVVSLLRHGSPPVVSRLTLGGTLDGWRLVSATRTTVTLSGGDGTTRVLQVGAGAQDRAPR